MNTDIATRSKLVTAAQGLAQNAVAVADVKSGLAAADAVKDLVVTNDDEAVLVTDQLKTIKDAQRSLKKAVDAVLEIPKAMVSAVRNVARPTEAALSIGEQVAKGTLGAWMRKKEEDARIAREAADKAERERAAQQAEFDDDAPPPMEVAPVEEVRRVTGSSAMVVTQSTLKCELVNVHECDPTWLKLNEALARDFYRYQVKTGEALGPDDLHEPVVVKGVRFWYEKGVAVR